MEKMDYLSREMSKAGNVDLRIIALKVPYGKIWSQLNNNHSFC